MTVQQLKYIIKVAETGSITEAAKALFISQPSLSNAIREIEKRSQTDNFYPKQTGYCTHKRGLGVSWLCEKRMDRYGNPDPKFLSETLQGHKHHSGSYPVGVYLQYIEMKIISSRVKMIRRINLGGKMYWN